MCTLKEAFMKKILFSVFFFLAFLPSGVKADGIDSVSQDDQALWAGTGAQDATYSAVSISMLGWGLGLAGGIALLASAIHQSSSSHDSSSCSH